MKRWRLRASFYWHRISTWRASDWSSKVSHSKLRFMLVIKRKEYAMGRDDPQFLAYVTEIVKVFNQVGMHEMNLGRHKVSLDLFRSLVRFLSG